MMQRCCWRSLWPRDRPRCISAWKRRKIFWPQCRAPEALQLLRQHGFDTPFIMVSGIYGEEEAVRMMKAGANDYVMKANLSRLKPAMERELLAAQDRRRRK